MRLQRSRPSTTHVDLQGDRMALEALQDMARQISERYIPMTVQHDIRYPPVGRMVSAEVISLEDGEFALDAVSELWEPGDTSEVLRGDGRSIPLNVDDHLRFGVIYDRWFFDGEHQAFILDLSQLAGETPELQMKKALEPVPILMLVAGGFALGSIASGFFNQLGSDVYEALKQRLKGFFKSAPERESLVDFLFRHGPWRTAF